MEKFAIDLDKVLDDFELSEDQAAAASRTNHHDVWSPPVQLPEPIPFNYSYSANLLDLSGADFAPDPKFTQPPSLALRECGDGAYSPPTSSKFNHGPSQTTISAVPSNNVVPIEIDRTKQIEQITNDLSKTPPLVETDTSAEEPKLVPKISYMDDLKDIEPCYPETKEILDETTFSEDASAAGNNDQNTVAVGFEEADVTPEELNDYMAELHMMANPELEQTNVEISTFAEQANVEQSTQSVGSEEFYTPMSEEPSVIPNLDETKADVEDVAVTNEVEEVEEPRVENDEVHERVLMARPTSLEIPEQTGVMEHVSDDGGMDDNCPPYAESPSSSESSDASGRCLPPVDHQPFPGDDDSLLYATVGELTNGDMRLDGEMNVSPVSEAERALGRIAPIWVPDSEAANCMLCDVKFTVLKRRHHCRACGKVLCSQCCGLKTHLSYMEKEARVCQPCLETIGRVKVWERYICPSPEEGDESLADYPTDENGSLGPWHPNPNNPSEYCSTIPPLKQAAATRNNPPPTVMVPVGVLKREGSRPRGEPKQVMFSDGIRPGGDLTELDGSIEPRLPYRRQGRVQKRVERIGGAPAATDSSGGGDGPPAVLRSPLMPGAPHPRTLLRHPPTSPSSPAIEHTAASADFSISDDVDLGEIIETLKDETSHPIVFHIHKNLRVLVKIVTLDCCVNRTCWSFTSQGMTSVGQDEIIVLLEVLPDEGALPRELLFHFRNVYDEASKGNTVSGMDHSLFNNSFLGSREHSGFLYIRPTFQCLHKLVVPPPPYLIGILLQKWEVPWAKVFPLRLLLRLGAEHRYYPCPLFSQRFRKPVFFEIGHTIMNLLADFRNYQYMPLTVPGLVVHMEDKVTTVNFPRNRYDETMKAVNTGIDHVLALAGNFSLEADSHLVCVQNDDGKYQTQAINIKNKPRRVTGASFVVFNGALKSSSGVTAKSSIVEDGVMVQVPTEVMVSLRQALRDMKDFMIPCGPIGAPEPEEIVMVQWTEDDKRINVGVKSVIDGLELDGVPSIRIHCGTDYVSEKYLIRWTEVFLIHTDDALNNRRSDPVDVSKISDTLAQACCVALTQHLAPLVELGIQKIALRVTLDSENVGYEVGSNGESLPPCYMKDLDTELVPVVHRAVSPTQEAPVVLELIFHILKQ